MSTILIINSKEPSVCVTFNQPSYEISGIQLIDYDFPDTYEIFEVQEAIKSRVTNKTLLPISPGNYSFKMLQNIFNHSDCGVDFFPTGKGYNLISKKEVVFITNGLAKKLDIPRYLQIGKYYPVSFSSHEYNLYCNLNTSDNVFGQILKADSDKMNFIPTNLLAILPSKSGDYPVVSIREKGPINSISLTLQYKDGDVPNFSGVPFRISLRVLH